VNIGQASLAAIRDVLAGDGLGLRLGVDEFRLRSPVRLIAEAVRTLHAHRPLRPPAAVPDFTLDFQPGIERLRPSLICSVDGAIWHTWPTRLTVAAMEWITSWCFFRTPGEHLAIHGAAAVHPASGQAIVFPGLSGAGKSTLASTLMLSGWTLLSDEISLLRLSDLSVVGLGRPTILKWGSLDLIRRRFPGTATFGPEGKILDPPGPIAHLQPTVATVAASGHRFDVAAFVMLRRDDAELSPRLELLSAKEAFVGISQLGINYRQLGEQGFRTAVELTRTRPAFELHYRDAAEAESFLRNCEALASEGVASPDQALISAADVPSGTGDRIGSGLPTRELSAFGHQASPSGNHNAFLPLIQSINQAMETPEVATGWSDDLWGEILALANHIELLPQLAHRWLGCKHFDEFHPAVQRRLRREVQQSEFTRIVMSYEMEQLGELLSGLRVPLVLLKGCAYLLSGQRWPLGRRTSDVDLLFDESHVDAAGEILRQTAFEQKEAFSEKDRRYFRRWLHELPPVKHPHRMVEIDLHFRLLPAGDPCTFAVDDLIRRAVPIAGTAFHWLDPIDRVIHGAINLGHTGEFRRAFRDLWDLRQMIEDALGAGEFDWQQLSRRSQDLRIERTVARVLLLAGECVGLQLPEGWCEETAGRTAKKMRRSPLYRTMRVGAMPDGIAYRSRRRRAANWLLEHYPMPRLRTWVDPLTWTKRVKFIQGKG
jgi:HprK-related kinase A